MKRILAIWISLALLILLSTLVFGVIASLEYVFPGMSRYWLGFETLRPLHVSSALFWILIASSAFIYFGLDELREDKTSIKLTNIQLVLWIVALIGVYYSYLSGRFGGREYWEFDPVWALPIASAWLVMLVNFVRAVKGWKSWPVYIWMWMTGIVFFLFIFGENQLSHLPFFKQRLISDMTVQWKVNGSIVGAWNQMVYGTAFYLMDRISGRRNLGSSKMAFAMYFLGLFNLMFNWGHHVYTLPTAPYVRHIGYLVSMTEWVFFVRIIYTWKSSFMEIKENYKHFPYRFIMASNLWVFLNMGQAILMSIPAVNLYTHGTHVTVAHAMGTTIGINTMILLAACFEFLPIQTREVIDRLVWPRPLFHLVQICLLSLWLSLNLAGISKGIWQMSAGQTAFSVLMKSLEPCFYGFAVSGIFLMLTLSILVFWLIRLWVLTFKEYDGNTINQ